MANGTEIYMISGHSGQTNGEAVVTIRTASGKCYRVPEDVVLTLAQTYATSRPSIGSNITAQSEPDYDEWGWDEYWTCADWMAAHQKRVLAYGVNAANEWFIDRWSAQDGFMAPYNWCKYDADFANYFNSQGINVGWLLSNVFVTVSNVTQDGLSIIEDTTDSLSKFIETLKPASPFLLAGAIVWLVDRYAYRIFPDDKRVNT